MVVVVFRRWCCVVNWQIPDVVRVHSVHGVRARYTHILIRPNSLVKRVVKWRFNKVPSFEVEVHFSFGFSHMRRSNGFSHSFWIVFAAAAVATRSDVLTSLHEARVSQWTYIPIFKILWRFKFFCSRRIPVMRPVPWWTLLNRWVVIVLLYRVQELKVFILDYLIKLWSCHTNWRLNTHTCVLWLVELIKRRLHFLFLLTC